LRVAKRQSAPSRDSEGKGAEGSQDSGKEIALAASPVEYNWLLHIVVVAQRHGAPARGPPRASRTCAAACWVFFIRVSVCPKSLDSMMLVVVAQLAQRLDGVASAKTAAPPYEGI
jgi:hypothetical protein